VTDFYTKVLSKAEKDRLADNIAAHASAAQDFLQERVVNQFSQVTWPVYDDWNL
jgi:catalase